ncbi:hypothetical protein SELMODRAFT_140847 [Selaginella moellendorffii]|uniref:Plastid ribosomal protein S13 n=1 Tax=Selaginella moellendorffii TaxID=88036 RepID=D8QSU4_SELML|nr:30S ribosomal protein S13, chloroplastic [Selaginella moellendorffii]EFJ37502.1 hypothetical protein SELMODRAFT_140847 [Selaginella moellendorffii]|eukprot:XP_002962242.1 30S ribosomal protein S13, chloroplastic [Selaginella moellendorffii]
MAMAVATVRTPIEQWSFSRTVSRRSSPPTFKIAKGLSIRCARVGGVEIPNNKRIESSLQYIHGVGQTTARQILLDCAMDNKRTKDLSDAELTKIRDELGKYMIEGDLRRFNQLAINHLIEIQCYRGKRHQAGLPVRGQRTKNNARTRKGKKKGAVAGKKKAGR